MPVHSCTRGLFVSDPPEDLGFRGGGWATAPRKVNTWFKGTIRRQGAEGMTQTRQRHYGGGTPGLEGMGETEETEATSGKAGPQKNWGDPGGHGTLTAARER